MFKGNWTWALMGIFVLLLREVASRFPEKTEYFYSRTIFPGIRNILDNTLSLFSFPTVYLFLALVLFLVGRMIFMLVKIPLWKEKFGYFTRSVMNGAGALVFFFLVLWGFNYQRIPVFEQIGLTGKALDEERLMAELELTKNLLRQIRSNISDDTLALPDQIDYQSMENLVRDNMRENLFILGLNHSGKPRTKEFYPAGFMRKMGILGIYFPFTGESYIDPTLHHLEKPFTVAHEMAHAYGVTDEGEANFIAWVICSNSDDALIQYSGQLRLFRYQLNDLFRMSKESYTNFAQSIPRGIKSDLAAIREAAEQVKPFSPELSRKSNDLFLKTQGVKAGVLSYQQLPMLAHAWRNSLKEL